jgi:hypothetical protein
MRKFIAKQRTHWRGCQRHEDKIINKFLALHEDYFDFVVPQFAIFADFVVPKSFLDAMQYDYNYLTSPKIDAIFIHKNLYQLAEIKTHLRLDGVLQLNWYQSLMDFQFPKLEYLNPILLFTSADERALKEAAKLNILTELIQFS